MSNKWNNNSSPYGTYDDTIEDRGNEADWKGAFEQAKFSREKSSSILAITNESPYDILEILAGSSKKEIKSAFRKLIIPAHPDKSTGSREKFDRIFAAYSILS